MRPLAGLICSVVLTVGSALMVAEGTVADWVTGAFGVLFFGFGAVVFALNLFARRRAPRRLRSGFGTSAIGAPDATVAVRVDGRARSTPGLPEFDWHDCAGRAAPVGSGMTGR